MTISCSTKKSFRRSQDLNSGLKVSNADYENGTTATRPSWETCSKFIQKSTGRPDIGAAWTSLRSGRFLVYHATSWQLQIIERLGHKLKELVSLTPKSVLVNSNQSYELWFQQVGATCHTARATIDLLKDTFGDRLISRFGPVNWPPRSCDLTPLDYFLWGYVKSLSMRISHKRLTIWKTTFAVLLPIYGHKCWKKSSEIGRPDWTTSEPAVAVICQKLYLKCNATRLSFE
ncbi:uncharacterized protein TNCV_419991 [Trichonephila clavipes]|uniref:Uncharacterized protein n=1 Tax=Trichonephila clavipes TaxID=2585209 RepID=A0A8X6VG35_TRICX|nr:uncharacterized protein TNCV_419991 [Trichonephila clavipes]